MEQSKRIIGKKRVLIKKTNDNPMVVKSSPVSPGVRINSSIVKKTNPVVVKSVKSNVITKKVIVKKRSPFADIGIKQEEIPLEVSNKRLYYLSLFFMIFISLISLALIYLRYSQNKIFSID